jgi:hypothetical protein
MSTYSDRLFSWIRRAFAGTKPQPAAPAPLDLASRYAELAALLLECLREPCKNYDERHMFACRRRTTHGSCRCMVASGKFEELLRALRLGQTS